MRILKLIVCSFLVLAPSVACAAEFEIWVLEDERQLDRAGLNGQWTVFQLPGRLWTNSRLT